MTSIDMKVETITRKNGLEIKVTREAKLDASRLSFEEVARFMADVAKINTTLKTAIKKDQWTEFEVCNYDWSPDSGMKAYDRWHYTGYPADDNCELDNGIIGYYLQPDKRYTPEHHDMVYNYTMQSITDGYATCRRG